MPPGSHRWLNQARRPSSRHKSLACPDKTLACPGGLAQTAEGDSRSRPRLFNILEHARRAMKISGVDIRTGNNIQYERHLKRAVQMQTTTHEKDGTYMQFE